MRKTMGIFLAALSGGLLSVGIYRLVEPDHTRYQLVQNHPQSRYSEYELPPVQPGTDFTLAADRSVNSVVHIKTVTKVNTSSRYMDPFEQFFFGNPYGGRMQPQMGTGSGVIMTDDGYVITNNHVIDGADQIEVTLNDKRTYKARLVGRDPNTDLAVIKIDETGLTPMAISNSDEVKVGQWVLAVGNPFNLTSTVTAGIVSAKGRNIDIIQENYKIESFIQTDAAVNPGNSGGALVNANGELVGINTAIQTHTGTYEGYSFAIPSNLVKKVAEDIIEFGTVQRGLLGVNIREIDSDLAKEKGIKQLEGVWVEAPMPGSAAEEAGIRSGDIILSVNGTPVNTVAALQEHVGLYRPGDKVTLTVKRDGVLKEIPVVLKSKNGGTGLVDKPTEVNQQLGARFEEAGTSDLSRLGLKSGVKVTEVTSGKLRAAGVRPGYIITEVNGKTVRTVDDITSALENSTNGFIYIGGMYPSGEKVFYSFN